MNEIATANKQLPDNLEDLSKFLLFSRAKLKLVKDAIKEIDRLNLATEVYEQKLSEGQDIAEAVLDAEARIGALTAQIEQATHDRGNQYTSGKVSTVSPSQTKEQKLEEIGMNKQQASRFERMARHPEVVEQAKADARAEGRIVTRKDVLDRIVVPRTTPTFKEFKEQARKEHEEFRETKQQSVVSFEDAKKDKENEEIVILETMQTFHKAFTAVHAIGLLKQTDVDEMIKSLKEDERSRMIGQAELGIKVFSHFIAKLGG